MTTHWNRIDETDNGPAYKAWLLKRTTVDEFNGASLLDRSSLRTQFDREKQQQDDDGTTAAAAAVAASAATTSAMQEFFSQDVTKLELDNEDHIRVKRMPWFDVKIPLIYWRQCYSYILCSTIAFFENVHEQFVGASADEVQKNNTMILTGVQGTGKSILGAIIGLFMANLFGWQLHYRWKNTDFWFGTAEKPTKVIHIVDLSHGKLTAYPDGFVLLVSSANKDRWGSGGQQQTASELFGNYCYIDPATEREVEAMAARPAETPEKKEVQAQQAREAFKYVGGVPHLCLPSVSNPEVAKAKVDGALAEYTVTSMVQRLDVLDDAITNSTAGLKVYPGLVGHFVPTSPFRNDYEIQAPSPYAARRLAEKERLRSEENIQKLMTELLDIPTARSFAGWIWEPLLTKKMGGESANISIVGSVLPVDTGNPSIGVLLRASASEIDYVAFENMALFEAKAKEYVEKTGDFFVFAKAMSDSFAAIDAIIMFRRGSIFVIAALQLTVAEKHHSVLQSMMIEFVETCSRIGENAKPKPEPQLWFLQPEQSLSYFRFVHLQAMEFDEVTFPANPTPAATTGTGTRRSKRPRYRRGLYGTFAPSSPRKGKLKSNDRNFWHQAVRTLPQFVGVVRISQGTTKGEANDSARTDLIEELKGALKNLEHGTAPTGVAIDPSLRSWTATTAIMEKLEEHLDTSLMNAIQKDIALDKQALEAAGVHFACTAGPAETMAVS